VLTRRHAGRLAGAAVLAAASPAVAATPREIDLFVQRPLFRPAGLGPAAQTLLTLLRVEAARDPSQAGEADRAAAAIAAARDGGSERLQSAERILKDALLAFAARRDQAPDGAMTYVDASLRPRPQSPAAVLADAAAAADFDGFVAGLGRVNPIYDALLAAWLDTPKSQIAQRDRLRLNLARAKALPRRLGAAYVLVNIPAERLDMVRHDRVVDAMKVVVGKTDDQTPPLAALIRTVTLRPYWNIPPDIVQHAVAPQVLKEGRAYLARRGFEVLSDWGEAPKRLDPARVDWRAVAAGQASLRVRQRPGPDNMMGRMKFMFPNAFGVYLHDTPLRTLFAGETRAASHGCVRLEAAGRLADFLLGPASANPLGPGPPETQIPLKAPVPVYIVYLTAAPSAEGRIETYPDLYGRDWSGRV